MKMLKQITSHAKHSSPKAWSSTSRPCASLNKTCNGLPVLLFRLNAAVSPRLRTFRCRCDASPPTWNPQNTDQPQVLPSPALSAKDCVRVQLDALACCDEPWPQHGIHTAYEFGFDIGGLDPSLYFSFPKDLYHLDHFMGMFQNHLPELVRLTSYEVIDARMGPTDDDWIVTVAVISSVGKAAKFKFHLKRKKVGTRKGSLMTAMISREDK